MGEGIARFPRIPLRHLRDRPARPAAQTSGDKILNSTFRLAGLAAVLLTGVSATAALAQDQGAIGGAINVVNKAPTFGKPSLNAYFAVGSFGTTAAGVGGSRTLTDQLALRLDLSRTATDGYVHGAYGESLDGTMTLLWKPTA